MTLRDVVVIVGGIAGLFAAAVALAEATEHTTLLFSLLGLQSSRERNHGASNVAGREAGLRIISRLEVVA